MSLKTATIIALIGIVVNSIVGFLTTLAQNVIHLEASFIWIFHVIWLFQMVCMNGGLILFLAVLYSKQKGEKL
jgi:hypothetical protein